MNFRHQSAPAESGPIALHSPRPQPTTPPLEAASFVLFLYQMRHFHKPMPLDAVKRKPDNNLLLFGEDTK
jgi:hypothetical protein